MNRKLAYVVRAGLDEVPASFGGIACCGRWRRRGVSEVRAKRRVVSDSMRRARICAQDGAPTCGCRDRAVAEAEIGVRAISRHGQRGHRSTMVGQ